MDNEIDNSGYRFSFWVSWLIFLFAIIGVAFSLLYLTDLVFANDIPKHTKEPLSTPREPCTWDIKFIHKSMNSVFHGKSAHAWLLTAAEQKAMFAPFVEGQEATLAGSWFQCAGKKVNIVVGRIQ